MSLVMSCLVMSSSACSPVVFKLTAKLSLIRVALTRNASQAPQCLVTHVAGERLLSSLAAARTRCLVTHVAGERALSSLVAARAQCLVTHVAGQMPPPSLAAI